MVVSRGSIWYEHQNSVTPAWIIVMSQTQLQTTHARRCDDPPYGGSINRLITYCEPHLKVKPPSCGLSCVCGTYKHLVGSLALAGHLHTCHHTYYLNIDLSVCVCVCFVLLCLCVYLCVGVCVRMLPSLALADHLQACHHAHHLSSDPSRNSLSSLYLSIFKTYSKFSILHF